MKFGPERRAVPAQLLKRLKGDAIELYSLQRGAAQKDSTEIGARDISTPDIVELGYRISELDLIVSVDTMVVHLAGALGRPVWVLLEQAPEWRWRLGSDDCPWYPSAKSS